MDLDDLPFDLESILIALTVVAITIIVLVKLKQRAIPAISDIKVYPIKSCAPIQLSKAKATDLGFENDRIAQVTQASTGSYCTPRDRKHAKLFHVKPAIKDQTLVLSARGQPHLAVNLADGKKSKRIEAIPMIGPKVKLQDYGDEAAKWLQTATGIEHARLTGIGADYKRVVEVNPDQKDVIPTGQDAPVSLADEAPYLLTSTSSLQDLNMRMKKRGQNPVDMQRFRPNIVIRGLKPWEEDSLKRIRLSGVEFHVWQRCGRCAMTTIDRSSLDRGPEPLATLNTFRERAGQRNFGMHMIPVASTTGKVIYVGDKLEILEYDEERRAEWERLFG